jgi:Ca2+-binding EF-hand superfamily protein
MMKFNMLVAKSLLFPAALLTLEAAAAAQSAPLGGPEGNAQTAPANPAPAGPAPANPAPAAPEALASAPNPQVVAFVDQQFAIADADKNGTLTAAEFTTWISGLKTAEMQKAGQPADAATVKAYADGALAKADADKDGTLTKTELVKFFGG